MPAPKLPPLKDPGLDKVFSDKKKPLHAGENELSEYLKRTLKYRDKVNARQYEWINKNALNIHKNTKAIKKLQGGKKK